MRPAHAFVAVLVGLTFAFQVQAQTAPITSQKQIEELKREISALKTKVSTLDDARKDLRLRLFKLELASNEYKSVVLDLTSRNYRRLDTDSGPFFVSVEDASPYLDGYRVILQIGNPSYMNYTGFKLKVTWNSTIKSIDDYEKWNKKERSKEVSFTTSLERGVWNRVEILLPETAGDQLGYFTVAMEASTVSLLKPR